MSDSPSPWARIPIKGSRIDSKGVAVSKGHMIVSSHELQFIVSNRRSLITRKAPKKLDREIYSFEDIKSYGCHENVLTLRLGSGAELVSFKLKEAVIIKEIMDKVIYQNRKATPRMPTRDSSFYDMSPSEHKPFEPNLLDNPAYFNTNNYSCIRPASNYVNEPGSESSAGSLSSTDSQQLTPGGFDSGEQHQRTHYTEVERLLSTYSPEEEAGAVNTNARDAQGTNGSACSYTSVDIEVTEALEKIEIRKI